VKKKIYFFILTLILSFNLNILYASEIKEFELEGMSIGDSLLDHFSKNEIKNSKQVNQYPNDSYILYAFSDLMNLKKYDLITISTKKNDKKYTVTSISAGLRFSNLDECLNLKKDFNDDISSIFSEIPKEEVKYKAQRDKTGKSMIYGTQYYFPSGDFLIANCMNWSKDMKLTKVFQVSMRTKEYSYFLLNEAYK